ncbi:MAG: hypothetical protein ACKO8I_00745 [Cyanobacteriota bacterium]
MIACSDNDLLIRLESAALADEPELEACESLADRLTALGATAAAARWRSWALLPPAAPQLLAGIAEARQILEGGAELQKPPRPPGWVAIETGLEQGASAEELERLVAELEGESDGAVEQRLALSQRLLDALSPRAALAALQPLAAEACRDARLALGMVKVHKACGHIHQAELWSRLSLGAQPAQPLLWFVLARLLLDQGVLEEALDCAEAGLSQVPNHPWGLKLRSHVLVANRGWHSFDRLAELDGLPVEPDFRSWLDAERARYRRGPCLGLRLPPLPGLDGRLHLRSLLREAGEVVVVHGRSAAPLSWLLEAGVWTEPPVVVPHASRDPLRLAEELTEAGFPVQREQPLKQLQDRQRIALLVVARAPGRRLPRLLNEPLRRSHRVLAPRALLNLPGRNLAHAGGWELLEGGEVLDG